EVGDTGVRERLRVGEACQHGGKRHAERKFFMCAPSISGISASGKLGLLPPPLAGRGGERVACAIYLCACPPPCPPPPPGGGDDVARIRQHLAGRNKRTHCAIWPRGRRLQHRAWPARMRPA